MGERLRIRQAVVVEGKYDKIKLEALLDTLILTTNGFGIFNNKEQRAVLRSLAASRGLVVLTDSDAAGFRIRGYLSNVLGTVPGARVTHVYIPEMFGKERRKAHSSAEGKLGVEGMAVDVLRRAFAQAGVTAQEPRDAGISRLDLYRDGLSGGENSARLRRAVCRELKLPQQLRPGGLLPLLNCMLTREEYDRLMRRIRREAEQQAGGD